MKYVTIALIAVSLCGIAQGQSVIEIPVPSEDTTIKFLSGVEGIPDAVAVDIDVDTTRTLTLASAIEAEAENNLVNVFGSKNPTRLDILNEAARIAMIEKSTRQQRLTRESQPLFETYAALIAIRQKITLIESE